MTQPQDTEGLIKKGTDVGEALADFLAALAGKPAGEVELIIQRLSSRLRGDQSPVPQPLRAVISPLIEMAGNAVAAVPATIADVAEAGGRVLTGDDPPAG